MPGLYRDEAIVLRSIKLGEADRIVTLYTRDHGKVRAVAKGVRKTKSRFGARLEPFTVSQMLLYKGRGDLDTITQVDVLEAFDRVRRDFDALAAASVFAEVVEKITPDRERSFSTYALLAAGLQALGDRRGTAIVPAFLLKLLAVSGFHPELGACAGCGAETYLGGFSALLGGAVCEVCWPEDQHAVGVAADRIEWMERLLTNDFGQPVPAEMVDEITQIVRTYVEHHIERPVKSLGLLRAV